MGRGMDIFSYVLFSRSSALERVASQFVGVLTSARTGSYDRNSHTSSGLKFTTGWCGIWAQKDEWGVSIRMMVDMNIRQDGWNPLNPISPLPPQPEWGLSSLEIIVFLPSANRKHTTVIFLPSLSATCLPRACNRSWFWEWRGPNRTIWSWRCSPACSAGELGAMRSTWAKGINELDGDPFVVPVCGGNTQESPLLGKRSGNVWANWSTTPRRSFFNSQTLALATRTEAKSGTSARGNPFASVSGDVVSIELAVRTAYCSDSSFSIRHLYFRRVGNMSLHFSAPG
jgi:hypothetical protein